MKNLKDNDAVTFRNVAVKIKNDYPLESLDLLRVAQRLRPNGKIINNEIIEISNNIKEKLNKFKKDLISNLDIEYVKLKKKTIWFYWKQGLDEAPDLIKESYNSWLTNNPEYDVILLDEKNLQYYLGVNLTNIFELCTVNLGEAGKSDLVRLMLLYKYGGIWVDATTFCVRGLDSWLNIEQDFFCFRQKSSNSDRFLVSWFLLSSKKNNFIKDWLESSLDYLFKFRETKLVLTSSLKKSTIDTHLKKYKNSGHALIEGLEKENLAPYFWVFYLFNESLKNFPTIEKNLEIQTNNHVQLHEELDDFKKCYVSKQTYKNKYTESNTYTQRLSYIKDSYNE